MLQTDRLTKISITLFVTNMTGGQNLISTFSRFELDHYLSEFLKGVCHSVFYVLCVSQNFEDQDSSILIKPLLVTHVISWFEPEKIQKL